ncbi:MAG TPA: leucine-rich repeat domain-containing protein [Ohtaekwangia sp.]|nr:leucine-rich repeat domain-containing protein [Ohtaekwangia sp.]
MRNLKRWLIAFVVLLVTLPALKAQQDKTDAKHEQKVRDMVAFLEYVLNTLGSSTTSSRDKDVLITESYTKIFRDAKVQIEDDLDADRKVITNKDVQAYLKDVDFFFRDVKFEFDIDGIQGKTNANGSLFYKVSMRRNLKGITADGTTVSTTIPRYIEINYLPEEQDLKIVSIYTNEFNEKGALQNWWRELSYEWQSIFQRRLKITDSVRVADLKNIAAIESLDISNNEYIQDLEPLSQLAGLRELNLSRTNITDLTPIRNLTELVELDISHTRIEDLSPLKYAEHLQRFDLGNSLVKDISVIGRMQKLQYLDVNHVAARNFGALNALPELQFLNLEGTQLASFDSIIGLTSLKDLNVARTLIEDVTAAGNLGELTILNLDSTGVMDITPLGSLKNLKVLHINYTPVSDLKPLQQINIEKIYCDQTPINRDVANAFMSTKPGVLVIFESENLKDWWHSLSPQWMEILTNVSGTSGDATKEDLAKITNLDSVNIAGTGIQNLEPLRKLVKLKVLVANTTPVKDLSPLAGHREILYLDIRNTAVDDLTMLATFSRLKVLRADSTGIQNIEQLYGLGGLEELYVDNTAIDDLHVHDFLSRNRKCLVVYKTGRLKAWWDDLSEEWKEVFMAQLTINAGSRKEDLHRLTQRRELKFQGIRVANLSPLLEFVRIEKLAFSGTDVTDLGPLSGMQSLASLHATNSPIRDLEPLWKLSGLVDLDIANTPVEDIGPVGGLSNLKSFSCAGTRVSKLNALSRLALLEVLDCSNTPVKRIDPVANLPLHTLKCYNTRISKSKVESFKNKHPECNVIYYR